MHFVKKGYLFLFGFVAGVLLAGDASADYLRLSPVALPFTPQVAILWAESISSFAIADNHFRLHQHDRTGWREPIDPPPGNWRGVFYARSSRGVLRAFCVDNDYGTELFVRKNGSWIFDGIRSIHPVIRYLETNGEEWVVGDWGSLFHRVQGEWRKIAAPTENHIFGLVQQGSDSLWMAARGDGLILRTAKMDRFISIPNQEASDIDLLQPTADGIVVSLKNGSVWRVNSRCTVTRWMPVAEQDAVWMGMDSGDSTFLFFSPGLLQRVSGEEVQRISLPFESLEDLRVFSDGTCLLLTMDGRLIEGIPDEGTFFYELTSRMRVGGSPGDITIGAAPANLDSDPYPELFVLNGGTKPYNQLFSGTSEGPFSDITQPSGLIATQGAIHSAFGDINGDGLIDLVIVRPDPTGAKLEMLYNLGDHRFSEPRRIRFNAPSLDPPVDLNLVDANRDGKLDIVLSYYYGSGNARRGRNVFLIGHGLGRFTRDKTNHYGLEVQGWMEANLFADLDGDGWLDDLVLTRWIRDKMLWGGPDGFLDDLDALPDTGATASYAAVALDFDHDGDLDLALRDGDIGLRFFENGGDRTFSDVTSELSPPGMQQAVLGHDLRAADLDGDGWMDLCIAAGNGAEDDNHILLGSAKGFHEASSKLGLNKPAVTAFVPFDRDGDGDVDLIGLREGSNLLWMNQRTVSNVITLQFRASRSNAAGLNAAWRIYPSGSLDIKDSLFVSGQLGLESGRRMVAHGVDNALIYLPPGRRWDIRVQFYGGASRVLLDVPTGTNMIVRDYPRLVQAGILFPAKLYSLLQRRSVHFHMLGFLIALAALGGTLQIGNSRFRWGPRLQVTLALGAVTVWWLMLLLTESSRGFLRFSAPPGAVLVIMALTLGLTIWGRRYGAPSRIQTWDELLQTLLVFAHGAWASSNLDSIRRLSEFVLRSEGGDVPRQLDQLAQRTGTWKEMTEPNLRKMVELARSLQVVPSAVDPLDSCRETIATLLEDKENWPGYDSSERFRIVTQLTTTLDQLREHLRRLRDAIYRHFSSNVNEILRHTVGELQDEFVAADVPMPVLSEQSAPVWGLIHGWELADILDNCLRNSIRAVRNAETKSVTADVESTTGRVLIRISDNGRGIRKEDWDRIFEEGVSGSGGTGHGLAQARKLLSKVGGNIFITESQPNRVTTFMIQLNEGRENFEASDSHR